jgi:hypothetical protein
MTKGFEPVAIVAQTHSMSDDARAADLAARLKRDVGISRGARVLAEALAVRLGMTPAAFSSLPADERDWCRRTVRSLIEIYEQVTGITPANVDEVRAKDDEAKRAAVAVQNRLDIERSVAAVRASERGHELGPWQGEGAGVARASCVHCRRVAVVDIHQQPPHAGLALTSGCLSEAERRRPDAFLSAQPNAAREGDL